MARLFVALIPPPAVAEEIAALSAPLAGAHWIAAENFHLTLRFVGETDDETLARYEQVLAAVAVEPFILPVGRVGFFGDRGPMRVLWAGVGNGHTRLYQLRKRVDEALLRVTPGLAVGSFRPHFTVARLEPGHEPAAILRWAEKQRAFEGPPFRVDRFELMASEAGRYRVVREFPLGG